MIPGDASEMARLWARTWRAVALSEGRERREQGPSALERSAAEFAYIGGSDRGPRLSPPRRVRSSGWR